MFVTAYNFSNLPSELIQEKVSDEVLVEPSESFTVRELIYRLAMGMPVSSGVRSGDYPDHDQDFDDVLPTEDPDFDLADYATLTWKRRIRKSWKRKRLPTLLPTLLSNLF